MGLGEVEKSFDWMEKAIEEREGMILHIHIEPSLDPLRSQPRYRDLLRKMNLKPEVAPVSWTVFQRNEV